MAMRLYVLTCQRDGAMYAPALLKDLSSQQWAGSRILWSDGPAMQATKEAARGWRIVGNKRTGPPNTYAFIALILDAAERGENILFLEDDIQVVPGFLPYVAAMGCPSGLAYISWFDAGLFVRRPHVGQLYIGDAGEVLPAQARTIPIESVRLLAASTPSRPDAGLDAWMADVLQGMPAAIHTPSLVQHVGETSSANPGASLSGRRSHSWPGSDLNAVDLIRRVPSMHAFVRKIVRS